MISRIAELVFSDRSDHMETSLKRRLKDILNEDRRPVDKPNIKSKPTSVSEDVLSRASHSNIDMHATNPLEIIHS